MIQTIDLKFMGIEKAIACFLLETKDGVVLFETGPYSTFKNLKRALFERSIPINAVKKVFLTHIHLDHAGAAWALAEAGADIYVHPVGKPHLENPGKLFHSAQQIYQENMEKLWAALNPIPAEKVIPVSHLDKIKLDPEWILTAHHTPGHAGHHIAWELKKSDHQESIIFAGDVAGIKIGNGPVDVPLPPPDINLDQWEQSIQHLIQLFPKEIYLTHFGKIDQDLIDHFRTLKQCLNERLKWFKDNSSLLSGKTEAYETYIQKWLSQHCSTAKEQESYQAVNPPFMSVLGMERYLKKFPPAKGNSPVS